MEAAPDIYFRYTFQPRRRFAYISPAIQGATGFPAAEFNDDPALCLRRIPREERPFLRQIARARRPLTGRSPHTPRRHHDRARSDHRARRSWRPVARR
jgi:hypothetical protein